MQVVKRFIVVLVVVVLSGLTVAVQPSEAMASIRFSAAGDLTVLGQNARERIIIRGISADSFYVTVATTTSSTTEQFTGDIRNVTVNSRGGEDTVDIQELEQPIRNLTLRMGSGLDAVELRRIDIDGQLRITQTGTDGSEMVVDQLRVKGRTTVSLGGGHNIFDSDNNVFEDNYRLFTAASGRLDFSAAFDGYRANVDIRSGNQRDLIFFSAQNGLSGRSVRINARGGHDDVVIRNDSHVDSALSVRLGSGDDKARFSFAHIGGSVSLHGDAGDDLVEVSDTGFRQRTTFNGGAGTDTYTEVDSTFVVGPDLIGFETVS